MKASCPGTGVGQEVKEHHFTSDDMKAQNN